MEYIIIGSSIIVAIIFYILINKYNTLKRTNGSTTVQLEAKDSESLTEEIQYPWVIDRVSNTEMTVYNTPQKLKLTENIKNQISNVMKMTPMKDVVQKENKLILKFKDEIVEKLKTGELKLVKVKGGSGNRAIAANNKGKFAAHGKWELQEIKKVNPAQLANAALGVMSVITAQEYLERINQQLKSIDRKVDILIRQIKNDKYGINKGNVEYLKLIYADLSEVSVENNIIYRGQIQQIIRESHQQVESILNELPVLISEVSSVDARSWFELNSIENEISSIIKNFEDFVSLALGNLEVLAISVKIKRELSDDSSLMDTAILENIDEFLKRTQKYESEFIKAINLKISSFNAKLRTEKAVSLRQEKLRMIINKLKEELQVSYKDVNAIELNKDFKFDKQFDLQIEQDESGEILNVFRLDKRENIS